jgi:hypothetical protein
VQPDVVAKSPFADAKSPFAATQSFLRIGKRWTLAAAS